MNVLKEKLLSKEEKAVVKIDKVADKVFYTEKPEKSAYQVAEQDFSKIETPRHTDREPWLWHLSYNQFTLEEMESGFAYDCIS